MNITEDYVTYETAKLLKEKGFDEETRGYYPVKGDATGRLMFGSEYPHNHSQVQISTPTQALAMKWLREEKRYYIQIMLNSWALGGHIGYYIVIQHLDSDFEEVSPCEQVFYDTYEEACEAAIIYTLKNLI